MELCRLLLWILMRARSTNVRQRVLLEGKREWGGVAGAGLMHGVRDLNASLQGGKSAGERAPSIAPVGRSLPWQAAEKGRRECEDESLSG